MIRPPKKRQLVFLQFIYDFYQLNGIYPIHKEMAKHFGISMTAVQSMIARLERDKWLTKNTRGVIIGITDKTLKFVKQ